MSAGTTAQMNLFYCEQCHTLIREADIASKAAVVTGEVAAGEERYLCPSCNAKKTQHPAVPAPVVPAPAPAPAATVIPAPPSAKFSAASTAHIKIPRETRETARAHAQASSKARPASPSEKKKNAGGPPIAAIGGGAAALVVLLIIFYSMNKTKPTAPKPDPTKTVAVTPPDTTTTPDPTPLTNTQTPPTNTQSTTLVPQNNQGTVVPPPLELPNAAATGEDSPRERMARREFDAIKTWGQEHAGEPYEYIVRLSEFQFRNRTNRLGKEAEKLLGEIKVSSRVDQTLARWTLDDSDATSGITLKGKAHITGGHVGRGAVALAGDNEDYVELGSDPALNIAAGTPFSIAGWFRTAADNGMLVSFRNSKTDSTVLDIAVGNHGGAYVPGSLMALVRQDGANKYGSVIGGKVNDNAWHHFALTRNSTGTIRLYLDGVFQASNAAPESGGALTSDWRGLGMELYWLRLPPPGKPPQASGFKGEMDDVRMYGIALTDPEIRDLLTRKL